MAKNGSHPVSVDIVVRDLIKAGLVSSHVVRDCRYTGRGTEKKPVVDYRGIINGHQVLLEIHCGSRGCYKAYVVPTNRDKLEAYISSLRS